MFGPYRFGLFCLAFFVLTPDVYAHKLEVKCRVADGKIRVEAFYDDGTPAQEAQIFLDNDRGHTIREGVTDERGVWTTPKVPTGKYFIRAESAGHADRAELNVGDGDDPEQTVEEMAAQRGRPWLKIVIGLAIIAIIFGVVLLVRRSQKSADD